MSLRQAIRRKLNLTISIYLLEADRGDFKKPVKNTEIANLCFGHSAFRGGFAALSTWTNGLIN